MTITVADVITILETMSPLRLGAEWDNCGLQVGDPGTPLTGIAVAVDPTYAAVEETIARGANLLIAHHPLLFKATKRLDLRTEPGRSVALAIQNGLSIYAAHTNLDATAVNVALAERIGIRGHRILHITGRQKVYKLGVYVPESHLDAVRDALWAAGAGRAEQYTRAGYRWMTNGQFQPDAAATPHTGAVGAESHTAEWRFECIVAEPQVSGVLDVLHATHPYDSPAFDLVELQHTGHPEGWGLVGDLSEPEPLAAFARRIKSALGLGHVRYVGAGDRPVRRVAWLGGSGGDYFKEARQAGADVYITGEIRHHAALDGLAVGLSYIEVGHVGSEQPVVPYLTEQLKQRLPATVTVTPLSQRDPFEVV